ncbi:MAG: hypothetical protein COA83_09905 [Methylophaga sp.]|nr:MAG: hypothetical protein COA83_09905 [Methylophaga sp.]
MRDYEFTIKANGQDRRPVIGSFIKVQSATVDVRIIAEDANGSVVADLKMSEGAWVKLPATPFQTIRIENKEAIEVKVVLIIGLGEVDDSSLVGTISISLASTLSNNAATVGTLAALLIPANSAARSHIILNNSAGDIYIGNDAAVTTLSGFKITAGQTVTLDKAPTDAIFSVGSAAGLDVRILSELN